MLAERLVPVYYLLCLADICMLHCFFASMFQSRYNGWKLYLCIGSVSFCAFLENSFALSWLNLICLPIICFLYVLLQFRVSVRNGVIYTLIFYVLFAGGEVTCSICHRFLTETLHFPEVSWITGIGTYFLLFDYFLRFLFLLLIVKYIKRIKLNHNQNIAWYLLITPIVSIIILIIFMYMEFPEQPVLQILVCVGALMLYFFNAVIFIIMERYLDVMNQLKREEVYKIKQELEGDNLRNIIKMNENYRCFIHDIHRYLRQLRLLASDERNEEIVGIINEMEGEMEEDIKKRIFTGHHVLNAILLERNEQALKKGIKLDIFVENFLPVNFITDADMISLFGNLLDNALEAAEKCEKGNQYVMAKFFMGNSYLFILHMENTFIGEIKYDGDQLETTKDNTEQHGLGVGIIRKLVKKYNGTLDMEVRGDRFYTTLTITVKNDCEDDCKNECENEEEREMC